MNAKELLPFINVIFELGFKLADVIEKSKDVSIDDKEAMKASIAKARDGVTRWGKNSSDKDAETIEDTTENVRAKD